MSNFLKFFSTFAFFTIFNSLESLKVKADNDSITLLEYYKALAKSGFLKKSHHSMHTASIKRLDIETSYAEHHLCAGSVISENSVLVLAECTFENERPLEPQELTVVVGIQYGSMYDQFAQILHVKRIRRHSQYNPNTDEHNIAVLMLNDSILTIGDTVQPAELATEPPTNYEHCKAVGFGVLFYKDIKLSQILEGDLRIWPMRLCQSYLRQHGKISNSLFCAGDLTDLKFPPCKLIASEPLYCHDVLYGISVFSIGCKSVQGFACTYVNVWDYFDWISQQVEMLRDDATTLNYNSMWVTTMLLTTVLFTVFPKFLNKK